MKTPLTCLLLPPPLMISSPVSLPQLHYESVRDFFFLFPLSFYVHHGGGGDSLTYEWETLLRQLTAARFLKK